jgi:hypothetical protein
MLVAGQTITHQANDQQQPIPTLAVVGPVIGQVANVFVDSGYYRQDSTLTAETAVPGTTVYAAMKRQSHGRSNAQLEARADPPPPANATVAARMAHRLDTAKGKQLYSLRKQTVEPVFGIIKQAIGFRRFLLRGQAKVEPEWSLMSTSHNLKRLFNLGLRPTRA